MAMRGAKARFLASGKVSDGRVAWTRNFLVQAIVRFFEPETNGNAVDAVTGQLLSETQIGPNVRLEFKPASGYKVMGFELTSLTEPELIAFRDTLMIAFDLALPVVRDRDKHAAAQDPSNSPELRLYRALPEVAYRVGTFTPYVEGVWERSASVADGPGGAESQLDGVRGAGDILADSEQDGPRPVDDWPEADER